MCSENDINHKCSEKGVNICLTFVTRNFIIDTRRVTAINNMSHILVRIVILGGIFDTFDIDIFFVKK